MKRSFSFAQAWTVLLVGAGLMVLAGCDRDDDTPAAPTATATEAAVASPTIPARPTATAPSPTSEPGFDGSREPVEDEGLGHGPAILMDVRTGRHEIFDRLVFEFQGSLPGYRIEYVSPPIVECGSGLPVEVAGGAFLRARFFPAAAHDIETGQPTFGPQELTPGLPALVEAESTCDFEGEVTWVAGLREEADFRVATLEEPFRVAIEVAHP